MILKNYRLRIIILISFFCFLGNSHAGAFELNGKVIDESDNPVIGATVLLMQSDSLITGQATKSDGSYSFTLEEWYKDLQIKIQALGYKTKSVNSQDNIIIQLDEEAVPVASISVEAEEESNPEKLTLSNEQFENRNKSSVITNNPINAIKGPQLLKQGSGHSSKLRVNGTSPNYYYNGIAIGDDPNHYGMFSVIPSSVVKSVEFYPNGSPVEYQLPVVVDIKPKQAFHNKQESIIDFSMIQTTGTYSYGTENYYAIGTVRKSVLDKLVKYLDIQSERRTLPPTNFQDVVISTGFKLTPQTQLFIDHFNTRDFLAYNTEATSNNKFGLNTYQHTSIEFTGLKFMTTKKNQLLEFEVSRKKMYEEYNAYPPYTYLQGLNIRLQETGYLYNSKVEYTRSLNKIDIKIGGTLEYTSDRQTTLTQINWNFTSPDATSNNPFIYQYELNQLYGNLDMNKKDFNHSLFTSASLNTTRVKFNSGVRFEYFSNLLEKRTLVFRNRLTYSMNKKSYLSFFFGTFAENPVKKVLEDYQVMVRANQSALKPQKTFLISSDIKLNSFKLSLFTKTIHDLAVPVIDYSKVISKKEVTNGFIVMASEGALLFYGGDLSFEKKQFVLKNLDVYAYYGYTFARKESNEIRQNFSLNAPHKIYAEFSYKISNKFTVGSDLTYRSGYSYTPYISESCFCKYDRYTTDYYNYIKSLENSQRFPSHTSLNLYMNVQFKNKDFYISLANLTNHGNPVVSTADGFVYDAGIMPSFGFSWKW